jgi:hypothetical protein
VTVRQSNAGRERGKSRSPSTAASIGDKVLARIFASPHGKGMSYTARIMKILDRRDGLILGVFRSAPGGGGRLMPIERRGEEYAIDPDFTGDAKDGDLVEVETAKLGRMGLPRAKVHVGAGLGGRREGDLDDRHSFPRHSAHLPGRGDCRSRKRQARTALRRPRGLAPYPADHHRSA